MVAIPYVSIHDKVVWGGNARSVGNLNYDVVQMAVYDDTMQAPAAGILPPVSAAKWGRMSFLTELNPSGSAGGAKTPPDADLFKICGALEAIVGTTSTTYTFNQAFATNHTAAGAVDIDAHLGNFYKQECNAAAGDFTMRFSPNAPVLIDWSFSGLYAAPSEAASAVALVNGGAAPAGFGTVTLETDTLTMREMTISMNTGLLAPRLDMSGVGTEGVLAPHPTSQFPVVNMLVELPAFATANFITDLTTPTLLDLSAVVGTGAGYVITTTCKGYLIGVPALVSIGGAIHARLIMRVDLAATSVVTIAFT